MSDILVKMKTIINNNLLIQTSAIQLFSANKFEKEPDLWL